MQIIRSIKGTKYNLAKRDTSEGASVHTIMKVVRVVGYNKPLQMDEAPEPKISGPLDVIVKIGAAGVCRTDIHILEGQWEEKSGVKLPYTIGHENAGYIHEIGDAVTGLNKGDKVILHPLVTCGLCRACRFGDDVHCEDSLFPGINSDGGYAEYIKTSARSVIKLDDKLEPADVAALADAGLTAYHAVAKAARLLRPGNFCVMIGAGGLGHIGVQVMKAISPATLIVIDRNPDALKLAKEIGADHIIEGKEDGSFVKEVMDLTGGKGAEAVIDFVAEGGSTATGVKMIRRAGNYYVVGYGELSLVYCPGCGLWLTGRQGRTSTCRQSTSLAPRSTSSATSLDLITIWPS